MDEGMAGVVMVCGLRLVFLDSEGQGLAITNEMLFPPFEIIVSWRGVSWKIACVFWKHWRTGIKCEAYHGKYPC